jgi:photosystem II stability/assembly factor-like uncharacterized protein
MRIRATQLLSGVLGVVLATSAVAQSATRSWTVGGSDAGARIDEHGAVARSSAQPAWAAAVTNGIGTANWNPLGPPGGDIADVAASPTQAGVVFAAVVPGGSWGGTLYRSTDAGGTWARVPNLTGISVRDLEFAPDGKAYAATQDGVWTSTDAGQTWTRQNFGIGPLNNEVFDIAIDPGNASTIWAGITAAAGFQTINLMRSTNGGTTWQDRTPPHDAPMNCVGIAIDPGDSNTVIAVFRGDFGGGEVWVTTDGGENWDNRSDGLPGNPLNAVVYDGTRLLVGGGQVFGTQNVGLYTSNDLGLSWTVLHNTSWPLRVVTDIAVDPNNAQTIVVATSGAGLNRTTDGGATWQTGIGGSGALAVQSARYRPGSSLELFAGTTSLGVFKSSNAGNNFTGSSKGISELNLFSVATSPIDPQRIAVAFQGNNNGGVFSSTDGGTNWTLEPVPPTRYSKVGFAPDGRLYAISSGPSTVAPEGLYRRESNGSWSALGPDQGNLYESDLAALRFSTNNPNLIFLGGADFGVAGYEGTIWRSSDAGQNWTKLYKDKAWTFVSDIEIAEDGLDQTLIAPYGGNDTPSQGGVLRSIDGGVNWTQALARAAYMQRPRLCASPTDPQTFSMFAAVDFSNSTVLRTGNAGATWTSTGWTGPTIADIACDPTDAQTLYIAQSSGARVARSVDLGVSFVPFASGLDDAGTPRELAITHASVGGPRLVMATSKGSYSAPLRDEIFADGFD